MRDMGIGVKRNIREGIVVAHEEGPDAQMLVHEIEYHLALRSRHAVGEREPAEDTVVPRLDHQGSGGISIRHGTIVNLRFRCSRSSDWATPLIIFEFWARRRLKPATNLFTILRCHRSCSSLPLRRRSM